MHSLFFIWTKKIIIQRMMAELAPQDKSGSYARPKYSFNGKIGEDAAFPDEAGRYHVYLGNPCPVRKHSHAGHGRGFFRFF
jgi:putative glutathione S-transferase